MKSAALCVLLLSVTSCAMGAARHRGAPIEGRVVDAETRQPLAGVIVFAEWRLEGGLHTDTIGRLHMHETVTDESGAYRIPAWGPVKVERGRLDGASPLIHFYKRGYRFQTQRNDIFSKRDPKADVRSEWDGKAIALVRHDEPLTRFGQQRESSGSGYLYSIDQKQCAWQHFPRLTAELLKRGQEYERQGIAATAPTFEMLGWGCPDPKELLREYLQ